MGNRKMDEKAAARIMKARGTKDPFAKRAAMTAKSPKETGMAQGQVAGQNGYTQYGSSSQGHASQGQRGHKS